MTTTATKTLSWADAQEIFAQNLPGYEDRPHQTALANRIASALAARTGLLAQAGTGTGKSLASLVPAIAHARSTGKPVMVSTATKALQAQYTRKDLPFLDEMLPGGVRYAAVMGRSNYACQAKLNELEPGAVANQDEILAALADEESDGNLETLGVKIDFRDRAKLATTSDECPGKRDCPFGNICFAELAKAKAAESDIVVVNHALAAMDTRLRNMTRDSEGKSIGILPEISAAIFDEGHEMEDYFSRALGSEFTAASIGRLASEIANFTKDPQMVAKLNAAAEALCSRLAGQFPRNRKDRTMALGDAMLLTLEAEFIQLSDALATLSIEVGHFDTTNDNDANRKKRLGRRITSLRDKVNAVIMAETESGAVVRWVEKVRKGDRDQLTVKFEPLHIGDFLHEELWSRIPAVVLSATLGMGNDFSYITERLGLVDPMAYDAGTPFDYPSQAALFVPDDMNPKSDRWGTQCVTAMVEMIKAAGGRALLLFTSTTAMHNAYEGISAALATSGLTLLMQGDGTPNGELAEQFKNDPTSVLFALKTFMTGIDVQGDALRLVVIDKLPFAVPTDVMINARCAAIDDAVAIRNGNKWTEGSFPTYTVPTMALTLLQAFGRLIRTTKDEGVVAILDNRLVTARYGARMMKAMPPAKRLHSLTEAVDHLAELTARRG